MPRSPVSPTSPFSPYSPYSRGASSPAYSDHARSPIYTPLSALDRDRDRDSDYTDPLTPSPIESKSAADRPGVSGWFAFASKSGAKRRDGDGDGISDEQEFDRGSTAGSEDSVDVRRGHWRGRARGRGDASESDGGESAGSVGGSGASRRSSWSAQRSDGSGTSRSDWNDSASGPSNVGDHARRQLRKTDYPENSLDFSPRSPNSGQSGSDSDRRPMRYRKSRSRPLSDLDSGEDSDSGSVSSYGIHDSAGFLRNDMRRRARRVSGSDAGDASQSSGSSARSWSDLGSPQIGNRPSRSRSNAKGADRQSSSNESDDNALTRDKGRSILGRKPARMAQRATTVEVAEDSDDPSTTSKSILEEQQTTSDATARRQDRATSSRSTSAKSQNSPAPEPRSYGKSRIEVLRDTAAAASAPKVSSSAVDVIPKAPADQIPLVRGDLRGPRSPIPDILAVATTDPAEGRANGETGGLGGKAIIHEKNKPDDVREGTGEPGDLGDNAAETKLKQGGSNMAGSASAVQRRGGGAQGGRTSPASVPLPRSTEGTDESDNQDRDAVKRKKREAEPERARHRVQDNDVERKRRNGDPTSLGRSSGKDTSREKSTRRPSSRSKETELGKKTKEKRTDAAEVEVRVQGGTVGAKRPRTPMTSAHRAARIAVLVGAPLLLAVPIAFLTYLTTLIVYPILGPPPTPETADTIQLILAALCSLVIWYITRPVHTRSGHRSQRSRSSTVDTKERGIRTRISVKVCLCLVGLSADLIATSARRLAGLLGFSGVKAERYGMDAVLEKAGMVGMGLLCFGGLLGGCAFAAVCYDHIYSPELADDLPAHALRSGLFTGQVVILHRCFQWGLAGSTNILIQRPEQTILFLSLLLTLLALILSEPPSTQPLPALLHTFICTHYSISPFSRRGRRLQTLCSRLPHSPFPLFLLLRLPMIVIALRQQVFLRPAPPYVSQEAGVRILASERGERGLVVVGESERARVRYLRVDDGVFGGRWARRVGEGVGLGDTLIVPPQEIALLAERPGIEDSVARTVSLTTDLQFPMDDNDSEMDRRALVIGVGIGTAPSTLSAHSYTIDAIEPEPLIYRAAIEHFNMPTPDSINHMDGYTFLQSMALIHAEERLAQDERRREKWGGRDMLVGTSPPRPERPGRKGWKWNSEQEEGGEGEGGEEDDGDGEGEGGGLRWGMIWMDGRSMGLKDDMGKEGIGAFWKDVRSMMLRDGILALDMTGIAQPRSMTIALIAAFEQCRGFTDHPGHTNSSITTSVMKPALIICTPSLQPLTFRRPSKLDVRRSPVRALLFDTFLRKEVALDEYVAGFNGTGTEVGDAGGMDIGRDEKARGMMRALLTPAQWTVF